MAQLSPKAQICAYLQQSSLSDPGLLKQTIHSLAISQLPYPLILVAGTNGKGSSCAFLSTILVNAGYNVGTFTSPHVFDYNERICLNNQPVSDSELIDSLQQVIKHSAANFGLFKTFTLASHLIFKQHNIDIAIIEVGIGGAEDVTNLFEPLISAVTTVGLDHCQILGSSIAEIAAQKAQIFRPAKAAFYADINPPASLVEYATKIGAKLACYGQDFGLRRHQFSWDFFAAGVNYFSLPFPNLRGSEQLKNASLALAILSELRYKFPLSLAQIKQGLLQTSLIGRFQVLPGTPQIILDTAHNPQAIEAMLENMVKLQFARQNLALFGVAADKDWQQIIRLCQPKFDQWHLAAISSARSAEAEQIKNYLISCGVKPSAIHIYANITSALNQCYQKLTNDDRLVCFGSFLVVEAAYQAIQKVRNATKIHA